MKLEGLKLEGFLVGEWEEQSIEGEESRMEEKILKSVQEGAIKSRKWKEERFWEFGE